MFVEFLITVFFKECNQIGKAVFFTVGSVLLVVAFRIFLQYDAHVQ